MRATIYIGLTALVAACAEQAPGSPTWFGDVQPLVMAHCARCHGADPADPSIAGFRLDRYVAGDDQSFDAYDYAEAMVRSAVRRDSPAMPPDVLLSDRQQNILQRWFEQGMPKGQRDNHPPRAELVAPAAGDLGTVDQSLELSYRAWDDDGDGLIVQLWAHDRTDPDESADKLLQTQPGAGIRDITVDTGTLASKHRFDIYAIVDDGYFDDPDQNRTRIDLIRDLDVDHGARGTAPTVVLYQPNGGTTLLGPTTITWSATDPDPGDEVLTIDIELLRIAADGGETVAAVIASDLPNPSSQSFEWDPAGVDGEDPSGDPILYAIRITATDTDAKNTRSDSSDSPFTIGAISDGTDYTWADVQPLLAQYCADECHGQPARTAAIEYFRLDKYDADDAVEPINADIGAYEVRADIYDRLVVKGTMPPAMSPQPSAADIELIADWILGGAPRGQGGGGDPRPTFTWQVPGSTAVATSGGAITLEWTASDDSGLTTGTIAYAQTPGPPSCNTVNCANLTMANWTELLSEDLSGQSQWPGTFDWTVPGSGCFCLRGQVTDDAGQTTTTVAPGPVRN